MKPIQSIITMSGNQSIKPNLTQEKTMAHIDCFEHVHACNYYGIPLYIPLVNIENDDFDDTATTHDIILGGGSGEHPMMIVHHAQYLPLWAILKQNEYYYINQEKYSKEQLDFLENIRNTLNIAIRKDPDYQYPMMSTDFFSKDCWDMATFVRCHKRFERELKAHLKNYRKSPHRHRSFESMFLLVLAKLIHDDFPQEFYEPEVYKQTLLIKNIMSVKVGDGFDLEAIDDIPSIGIDPIMDSWAWGNIRRDGKSYGNYSLNHWKKDLELSR